MSFVSVKPDTQQALDMPIWAALTSSQAHLGRREGNVCLYRSDVAPFAAAGPAGSQDVEGLTRLIADCRSGVTLLQSDRIPVSEGFSKLECARGVQMLARRSISTKAHLRPTLLDKDDILDMLSLVELTVPGPFRRNTPLMGQYFGIKVNGKLVAMAGERMKFPGYTEVSAVCVHPDHRGKGFARCLTAHVASAIFDRGETPFLHAYAGNMPAINLYRNLGFEIRSIMQIARLGAS